jgi:hypothetical protein
MSLRIALRTTLVRRATTIACACASEVDPILRTISSVG